MGESQNQNTLALANEHIRLEFLSDSGAFTGFTIAVRTRDGWIPVGASRPFGLVTYRSGDVDRELALLPTAHQAIPNGLSFVGSATDLDGVQWSFQYEFTLPPGSCRVAARYAARADGDRQVLAWRGPFVYAGEGAFGDRKTDALFPGLEWLLDDEASSGTENVAEKYARRVVPHPYKITVPLMAVSADGVAVGLFWDPLQVIVGADTYPAAIFDSPNRVEGQKNHLMGLFAPKIGRGLNENETRSSRPLRLRAGADLRIAATIVARPGDSLSVLEEWLRDRGLPEPPVSPRTDAEALALCVESYADVVWDPEARGWHHTLHDPWGPRYEPHPALQLWRWAQITADPEERDRLKAIVRSAVDQAIAQGKAAPHLDLAFHYGRLPEAIGQLAAQVEDLIQKQLPNGGFPFEPTEERQRPLGSEGDTSSGLTARGAIQLLKYARLTGDRVALASGRRALDYLRTQRRPEGAQTWELQVHVPDILAAAWAVAACVEGYRLSGDGADLAEARRWALAGLPFVYLWNPLFRPIMRYGSVPVFGATFYDLQPWFGVLVQWNGLDYARALIDLAAHDDSFPWQTIAKGLVACAIQQQAPEDHRFAGMYPDAYSVIKGDEEYTWWLHPGLIGNCLFPLAGITLDPETAFATVGATRVHVTAAGALDAVRVGPSDLTFRHRYPPDEAPHLLVAGCRVTRVEQDGQALPSVAELTTDATGWQELPAGRGYVIKAAPRAGESAFRVEYAP